jgi:hypothetical protein
VSNASADSSPACSPRARKETWLALACPVTVVGAEGTVRSTARVPPVPNGQVDRVADGLSAGCDARRGATAEQHRAAGSRDEFCRRGRRRHRDVHGREGLLFVAEGVGRSGPRARAADRGVPEQSQGRPGEVRGTDQPLGARGPGPGPGPGPGFGPGRDRRNSPDSGRGGGGSGRGDGPRVPGAVRDLAGDRLRDTRRPCHQHEGGPERHQPPTLSSHAQVRTRSVNSRIGLN